MSSMVKALKDTLKAIQRGKKDTFVSFLFLHYVLIIQ